MDENWLTGKNETFLVSLPATKFLFHSQALAAYFRLQERAQQHGWQIKKYHWFFMKKD